MPNRDISSSAANAYARSLLELAEERDELKQVADEVDAIGQTLDQVDSFKLFLADPAISETERSRVIDKTFAGKLSPVTLNFLKVLNRKDRLGELPAIVNAFEKLMDERLGKIEVDVIVAEKLDAKQLEDVKTRVGKALGKDAVVHQYVDPDIIGGIIVRVQDKVIDGSVRRQLQEMKRQLLSARN